MASFSSKSAIYIPAGHYCTMKSNAVKIRFKVFCRLIETKFSKNPPKLSKIMALALTILALIASCGTTSSTTLRQKRGLQEAKICENVCATVNQAFAEEGRPGFLDKPYALDELSDYYERLYSVVLGCGCGASTIGSDNVTRPAAGRHETSPRMRTTTSSPARQDPATEPPTSELQQNFAVKFFSDMLTMSFTEMWSVYGLLILGAAMRDVLMIFYSWFFVLCHRISLSCCFPKEHLCRCCKKPNLLYDNFGKARAWSVIKWVKTWQMVPRGNKPKKLLEEFDARVNKQKYQKMEDAVATSIRHLASAWKSRNGATDQRPDPAGNEDPAKND